MTPTLGILVVDDDLAVRNLLRAVLEERGYRVWTAQNGLDALHVFAERTAELRLVLTDISMPFMGGLALADALRQRHPDLPVVYVSGSAGEHWERLKDAAVLPKPFKVSDLLNCVEAFAPLNACC